MFEPYKLKSPLGRDYNVDLDDSLNAKKTFRDLGYYRTPSYGMTPYPDEPLFEAIENFQRDQGLRRDGVMKPKGETAHALGQEIEGRKKGYGPNRIDTTKQRSNFGLFDEIGKRHTNQLHDVISTKRALAVTGLFPKRSSKTDSGKANDELFNAVRSFQQKKGLKVDGWMRPYGETERALDRELAPMFRNATNPETEKLEKDKQKGQKEAAAVAIPWIVYQVAAFFGMSLMAALAWWQSMSAEERNKVRRQIEGNAPEDDDDKQHCEHLYYNIDSPRCRAATRKRGQQAGRRCWASAADRYEACLRGVPMDRLPPLDVWNN